MRIVKYPLGPLETNAYLVISEQKNALIIDPSADATLLINAIEEEGVNLKYILLTHSHFDHVGAVVPLKRKYDVPIIMHTLEDDVMKNSNIRVPADMTSYNTEAFDIDRFIKEGDEITLDNIALKVMHTPGHTQGSVLFIEENERVIFSGDTLFKGTIGRTDLYSGNYDVMMTSLERIKLIKGDYLVLPGHGENTTLLKEKAENPYL